MQKSIFSIINNEYIYKVSLYTKNYKNGVRPSLMITEIKNLCDNWILYIRCVYINVGVSYVLHSLFSVKNASKKDHVEVANPFLALREHKSTYRQYLKKIYRMNI
jgi:hypothetical protein